MKNIWEEFYAKSKFYARFHARMRKFYAKIEIIQQLSWQFLHNFCLKVSLKSHLTFSPKTTRNSSIYDSHKEIFISRQSSYAMVYGTFGVHFTLLVKEMENNNNDKTPQHRMTHKWKYFFIAISKNFFPFKCEKAGNEK